MRRPVLLPAAVQCPERPAVPRLLLPRRDAAVALGVSVRTLDTMTAPNGPLVPVRIGRRVLYSPDALKTWIASQSGAVTDAADSPAC